MSNNNNINWLGNSVLGSGRSNYESRKSSEKYNPTISIFSDSSADSLLQVTPAQISMPTQPTQPTQPPQPPMPPQPPQLPMTLEGPPPITEPGYIPYYLTQNIGRSVRAEFIIGNDQYADKTGILIEVGISYFVLEDVNSRTHIMCDLYSVKFVTILQDNIMR